MSPGHPGRYCRCGTRLARDNSAVLCAPCQGKARDLVTHPPVVPGDFWATDQLWDALESWHLGRVIAAYRAHPFHGRVLRQEIVAGWMGITQAQLSRIENGPAIQDLQKLRQWASILGIPGDLLWFKVATRSHDGRAGSLDEAPTATAAVNGAEIEDMNRRDLLRLVGVAGAALATPMLSCTEAPPLGSGEAALAGLFGDQHGALNAQLWQLYQSAQVKAAMLPLVRNQLDVLTTRISQARTATSRQRLLAHLADVLQLAGEISFDGNHYVDAANCYTLAAAASREAEHYDMWACSLIRHSFIPLYDRQFGNALPMLDAATSVAQRGDSQLPTRQWASTVTAHAHAGLGDLAACQTALAHAETVHDLTPARHTTGWLRFTGSRLVEERGTCLVELCEYERAEVSLTEALGCGSSGRRTGSIATDLAMIGAQLGDVDRVTTYVGRALTAAQQTKSGYIVKRLTGLQPHLGPLSNNRAVRHLGEQITHLSSTVATA